VANRCDHCKDRVRVVTSDLALGDMIGVQAKYIHQLEARDEVFQAIKRLIEAKDTEGAINMINSHFKNQEFKGNDED